MLTPAILVLALMGSANFAMHRAMLNSDEPQVQAIVAAVQARLGRHGSYGLEFAVLVLALALGNARPMAALGLYGGYTLLNLMTLRWLARWGD